MFLYVKSILSKIENINYQFKNTTNFVIYHTICIDNIQEKMIKSYPLLHEKIK